ncbi:TolC family protein [Microbulbifer magnicolonia]|uniref:TolC family protein n=1 Tax=Microbulbifer magnicolonia TaxID=3109744 RepID=UPI002B40FE06|nr:TolC family protein [Microbulbifer sp. GG15]
MLFFAARSLGAPYRHASSWLLVAVLLIPASSASAQTGALLTLSAAIERTLAQNPELAVFRMRDGALQGRALTAALRPPLALDAELENFAGTGGARDAELTVSISSVIELGGQRQARIDTVYAARDLLLVDKQVKALDLLGAVIRRYTEVLAATERVALAGESVRLAQDTLRGVKRRVDAAAAPLAEGLRAEAALAEARLTEQSEQRLLSYHKRALAALWGEPGEDFGVDSRGLYRFAPSAGFSELYAQAQQNPAIARFASEERLRESELRLAETQSSLDIGWSVGVRQSREIDETTLVAGVALPLFPARRNIGAVAAATAERDQVALRREAALLRLHSQLYRAVSGREQALAAAEALHRSIIPTLREALKQVERAYRRGRYSYVEWVTAREELLNAQRAHIEAARAALLYGAEIEQLTAAPLLPTAPAHSK